MKFRLLKKKRFRKILKFMGSKSFIGALFFAAALWTYTNLNTEFVTLVRIPLIVELPQDRAIENPLPPEVTVQVKGSGWHLFNLIFFNSAARCYVDLSREEIRTNNYEISRNDLLKSFQLLVNVQPIDVFPQSLYIKTGRVGEYAIPVQSLVKIRPREGFDVIGDIVLKPDIIVIRGNERIVSRIEKWKTKPIIIEDIFEPVNMQIPLSDSLSNIIKLSQPTVTLIADIQQAAELTIPDVKLNIRGGTLPPDHKIMPDQISITVRGGVETISKLSPESVIANLDYFQVINDSTGLLIPKISYPEFIRIIQIDPPYLSHVKVER